MHLTRYPFGSRSWVLGSLLYEDLHQLPFGLGAFQMVAGIANG
jgi:hypothetical protein